MNDLRQLIVRDQRQIALNRSLTERMRVNSDDLDPELVEVFPTVPGAAEAVFQYGSISNLEDKSTGQRIDIYV